MRRIRIYAGTGLKADGTKLGIIERVKAMEAIGRYASNVYGGFTMYRHTGSWKDGDKLVTEDGITIEVLTVLQTTGLTLADHVKHELQQKSVVLTCEEVNGRFV